MSSYLLFECCLSNLFFVCIILKFLLISLVYELEEEALPEEKIPTGIPVKDKAPPAKGISVPIQIAQAINPSQCLHSFFLPAPFPVCLIFYVSQKETNIFDVSSVAKKDVLEKKKPVPKEEVPLIQGNIFKLKME